MFATIDDLRLEKFLRLRERGELVWKDKAGNVTALKDLSDNHLDNILNVYNRHKETSTNIKPSSLNFY